MPGGSPRKVLVLGSDTRAFLAVIRSLGRRGLEVHVAWSPRESPALRSRYVRAVHELPHPRTLAEGWSGPLVELLRAHRFDLIIPCDDQSVLPLQGVRREAESLARLALPSDSALAVTMSKVETWRLAHRLGVAVPEGAIADATANAEALVAQLGLPLVIKPDTSYTRHGLAAKRKVRMLRTVGEVAALLTSIESGERVLAQKFFTGVGTGVEFLARDGEVLVTFQHLRVHEPLTGGGSSYRVSLPRHAGMLDATRRLARELRYTGVAMVEFKLDSRSGAWTLVEINPRFWGSLPLAVAASADFPFFLYQMLVDGRRDFPSTYRTGLYARNWQADLFWMRANLGADRSDPTLLTRPLSSVVAEVSNILRLRERADTFTLDDPAPALVELGQLGRRARARLWGSVRQRLSRLPAVRARKHKAARRTVAGAHRLLFVCKGNICRSPFAAAYAKRVLRGTDVASAGYLPQGDRPSPAAAIDAARAFGIDLTTHRSALVSESAVRAADVIFVFDEENLAQLTRDFPDERQKMYLLGSLSPRDRLEIADPYGEGDEVFRATYARIVALLDALAAWPRHGAAAASGRP